MSTNTGASTAQRNGARAAASSIATSELSDPDCDPLAETVRSHAPAAHAPTWREPVRSVLQVTEEKLRVTAAATSDTLFTASAKSETGNKRKRRSVAQHSEEESGSSRGSLSAAADDIEGKNHENADDDDGYFADRDHSDRNEHYSSGSNEYEDIDTPRTHRTRRHKTGTHGRRSRESSESAPILARLHAGYMGMCERLAMRVPRIRHDPVLMQLVSWCALLSVPLAACLVVLHAVVFFYFAFAFISIMGIALMLTAGGVICSIGAICVFVIAPAYFLAPWLLPKSRAPKVPSYLLRIHEMLPAMPPAVGRLQSLLVQLLS